MANDPQKSFYYVNPNGMVGSRTIGDILPKNLLGLSYNTDMNDDESKLNYKTPVVVADGFKIVKKNQPNGKDTDPPVTDLLFFQNTGKDGELDVVAAIRLTDAQAIEFKKTVKKQIGIPDKD